MVLPREKTIVYVGADHTELERSDLEDWIKITVVDKILSRAKGIGQDRRL